MLSHGIDLDRSRHPLVLVRPTAHYTADDWEGLLRQLAELLKSGPFGLINDPRGSQLPNAAERRVLIQFYRAHDRELRAHLLAAAIVGQSKLIRGVLTALEWALPAPHPVKICGSLAEAETWVLQHFPPELRARVPA